MRKSNKVVIWGRKGSNRNTTMCYIGDNRRGHCIVRYYDDNSSRPFKVCTPEVAKRALEQLKLQYPDYEWVAETPVIMTTTLNKEQVSEAEMKGSDMSEEGAGILRKLRDTEARVQVLENRLKAIYNVDSTDFIKNAA